MRTDLPPGNARAYRALRAVAGPAVRAYFRVAIEGAERVPRTGACIVAANHQSYLDPIVVSAACPRQVRYLMIRRFWEMPLIGWASRALGSFPVDEGRLSLATYRAALAVLAAGDALGIFPEGRIATDGRIGPARPGVGHLALRAGVPIVPVGIAGTGRAFPKGRLFPLPLKVRVRFGEPMLPETGAPGAPGGADALAERVMERIASLAQ